MDTDIEALLADISDEEASKPQGRPADASSDSPSRENTALSRDAQLETDIAALARQLQHAYAPRAPRLHEIELSATQLARVVALLGNEAHSVEAGTSDPLSAEVGSAKALAIRLALAEDPGSALCSPSWQETQDVAAQIVTLSAELHARTSEAAASLPRNAPNLAQILDAYVAARLLSKTGGLRQLGATSPANLVSVRSSPLLDDKLVDEVPAQYKKQAMRAVASKVVLAARMDHSGSDASGNQGRLWRRQIEARLDKLLAPPPSLQHRALPKPVDKKASRRGGQRIRKMKARQAPSGLTREQNMVRFGG